VLQAAGAYCKQDAATHASFVQWLLLSCKNELALDQRVSLRCVLVTML